MFFKLTTQEMRRQHNLPFEVVTMPAPDVDEKVTLRQSTIERIAQGNAIAEAEQIAYRKWRGY
ncbi:MAG: hypothetical protein RLP44_18835 [Aggregatilineales bacterium]